jgi:hypothetical protein
VFEFTCIDCSDATRLDGENCICEPGTYDVGVAKCEECDWTCETCSTWADHCEICSGDLVGAPTCVEPIPVAQSAKIGAVPVGSCKVVTCDYKCLTCESYASNCLECDEFRDINNDCKCSYGYYEIYPDCVPCNYKCEACTGQEVQEVADPEQVSQV